MILLHSHCSISFFVSQGSRSTTRTHHMKRCLSLSENWLHTLRILSVIQTIPQRTLFYSQPEFPLPDRQCPNCLTPWARFLLVSFSPQCRHFLRFSRCSVYDNYIDGRLFGVTCTHVFYYSQNYASDGILIKGTVSLYHDFTFQIICWMHPRFLRCGKSMLSFLLLVVIASAYRHLACTQFIITPFSVNRIEIDCLQFRGRL